MILKNIYIHQMYISIILEISIKKICFRNETLEKCWNIYTLIKSSGIVFSCYSIFPIAKNVCNNISLSFFTWIFPG